MAFVDIQPQYRRLLARQGLAKPEDFLGLDGVVCCGHPDRHVVRLTLGSGAEAVPAFLKREHRTRWRDRLTNLWAGFGCASRSFREFTVLRRVENASFGGPEPIAVGEDDNGRAFLLVRELEGYQDLRQFLSELETAPPCKRRDVARELGAALARLHQAGFEHPDLYSKHVLVSSAPPPQFLAFRFLDWQRARRHGRVGWTARWRDLANLDATLADNLASQRERLLALHSYLRASATSLERRCGLTLASIAREIGRRTRKLLERRWIREMRQPPLACGAQNVIWVDGEALLMTREFREQVGGQAPPWLRCLAAAQDAASLARAKQQVEPHLRAQIITPWVSRPWCWLWSWLRRRPLVAPALESMKLIFRLQRYGVVVPRLLAAGQKTIRPWQLQSFLVTEVLADAVPLAEYLVSCSPRARRAVAIQAAKLLRQMHLASCYLQDTAGSRWLTVCHPPAGLPTVALATVQGVQQTRHTNPTRARRDAVAVLAILSPNCNATDLLRACLAYLEQKRLTPFSKHWARRLLATIPETWRVAA
jgi:tRNA A-37 threonylcarbamoyl transferase component Bud32